jgi:hypothetical protein
MILKNKGQREPTKRKIDPVEQSASVKKN